MDFSFAYLVLPLCFLFIFAIIPQFILSDQSKPVSETRAFPEKSHTDQLSYADILQWEFQYIQSTASEAMRDRHTMINYYLIAVGIVASGVIGLLNKDSGFPPPAGTALLWGLCVVGLLYFLKIIRLREAWYESAVAMNRIKKVYMLNVAKDKRSILQDAFQWDVNSLPSAGKLWNVFHYSAMLIGFLNGVAFFAGSLLLNINSGLEIELNGLQLSTFILLALGFIAVHHHFYKKFLKK